MAGLLAFHAGDVGPVNLHYQAAREAGIPRAKIDTLTAWWETELHSEAERAALRYTEALTLAEGAMPGPAD